MATATKPSIKIRPLGERVLVKRIKVLKGTEALGNACNRWN